MVSVTTEDVLAGQLELTIKTGVATCANAGFGAGGAAIYAAGDLGSTTGAKVIGDSAEGPQAGDRDLAAGANEVLCAQVLLLSQVSAPGLGQGHPGLVRAAVGTTALSVATVPDGSPIRHHRYGLSAANTGAGFAGPSGHVAAANSVGGSGTDTWKTLTASPLPVARESLASATDSSGRIYAIGGCAQISDHMARSG